MALRFHLASDSVPRPAFIFPDIEATDRHDVGITPIRKRIFEPYRDDRAEWRTLGRQTADAALKALIGSSCASRFDREAFPARTEAAVTLVNDRLTASQVSRPEPAVRS